MRLTGRDGMELKMTGIEAFFDTATSTASFLVSDPETQRGGDH